MEHEKWVDEYIECLLSLINTCENSECLYTKMLNHLKKPLYKYCSGIEKEKDKIIHNWDVENFNNDILYFSDPLTYNDPYDSNFGVNPAELFISVIQIMLPNLQQDDIIFLNRVLNVIKHLESGDESYNDEFNSLFDEALAKGGDDIFSFFQDSKLCKIMATSLAYRKYISKVIIGSINEKEIYEIATNFIKSDSFQQYIKENNIEQDEEYCLLITTSIIEGMKSYINKFKISPNKKLLFSPVLLQYCFWMTSAIVNNPNISIDSIYDILTNLMESYIKHIKENISNTISTTCLSERNDSVLMWSHYANKHEGFCLEYDFSTLDLNNIEDQKLITLISPIKYSDKRPYLSYSVILEGINKIEPSLKTMSTIMNALLTKNNEWSYENEWRIFKLIKDPIDRKFPNVSGVYLGMKISDKLKLKVIEVAEKKQVPIYQMYMDTETYKMKSYKVSYY